MKVISESVIYENDLPQLRSRQSLFPSMCELDDGTLAASVTIGEAFESVDGASYLLYSYDKGKTWSEPKKMFSIEDKGCRCSECSKITKLSDDRLIALGYAFFRADESLPLGNPENGGLLDDFVFYSISPDGGKTWGDVSEIDCAWGHHVEASAPVTVLKDGTWITPITGFSDWNGNMHGKMCGRALCSSDEGKTWNDDAICMDFENGNTTCFEQRMCQLESGAVICIGWNENVVTGERYSNHYTVSYDNGKTWTEPIDTGVLGQASSLCALGGERFLALHSIRRDTDKPGIYGYVVDFSERKWNVVDKAILWEPDVPVVKNEKFAEIFAFLKFGQPGAILLSDGDVMMYHWHAKDGQYRTMSTRIKL